MKYSTPKFEMAATGTLAMSLWMAYNSLVEQQIFSAKQQVASDINRTIEVLNMFKTTQNRAYLAQFIEVIRALELVNANLVKPNMDLGSRSE